MIVLIRKKHLKYAALLFVVTAGIAVFLWQGKESIAAFSDQHEVQPTHVIVIDPGHGGEDGGAVAADGTVESHLNLEVALKLNCLMAFLGQDSVMTRTEDVSIHSGDATTLHEKKVSDLKNRVALVNDLSNSVLVSIHQNSLPGSPRTHGAQVFYNRIERADVLATSIQNCLNQGINTERAKNPKRIPDTIYLTKNVTAPAIIVECGFLSNVQDIAALKKPEYQLRLATAIAAGYFATEEF